ncbi:unnamed protein product, partial [Porites lobata]
SRKEQDAFVIPALYHCTSAYKTKIVAGLLAYKGILVLFGLFLTWETRHVTIPALNDSKYIGMSVYNVVVLGIIGLVVTFAFDGSTHYVVTYAISSSCVIVCTTVTLLLVFVPKIYQFRMKEERSITSDFRMQAAATNSAHSQNLNVTCAHSSPEVHLACASPTNRS